MSENAKTLNEIIGSILNALREWFSKRLEDNEGTFAVQLFSVIVFYGEILLINTWWVLLYSWIFLLPTLAPESTIWKLIFTFAGLLIVFCISSSTIDYNHNQYTGYHSRYPLGPSLNTIEVNLIGFASTLFGSSLWASIIWVCEVNT